MSYMLIKKTYKKNFPFHQFKKMGVFLVNLIKYTTNNLSLSCELFSVFNLWDKKAALVEKKKQ